MAFVAPTLLFFAVFKYGPMLWAIGLSFTSYDMVSTPHFVGLENYGNLVTDIPADWLPAGPCRAEVGGRTTSRRADCYAEIPPEEAAGPVLFFCSPLSDYVTGEVLLCSGGSRV